MKAKIEATLSPNMAESRLVVDGKDLSNICTGMSVRYSVPGVPEITVDLFAHSVEVSAEGIVTIGSVEVPQGLAYEVYLQLRNRFER